MSGSQESKSTKRQEKHASKDAIKKTGAAPALAAHSKDAKSDGKSGQAAKPGAKKG